MGHALIMEDNIIVGHAIERQLADAGFHSFDHAWTESQAIEYAQRHAPALIVIGDRVEQGSAIAAVRTIGRSGAVPVLFATTDISRPRERLPADMAIHGPCRLDEIGDLLSRRLSNLPGAELALSH